MSSSRISRVADAVRPAMKARLMLAGPAGAGKTHTALTIATVLADGGKPLVIDTEEESALTYADRFDFVHLPWDPPFDPQELANVVADVARDYPVVIIDSASHFWMDEGGTLDIAGGKFTGWKAARPKQRDMIVSVLRAQTHMIVCVRSKMEYTQEEKNGKQVVSKLGMAPIQDSTFEFEMNVSCEIDMQHKVSIGKTRCDLLDGREYPAGHAADLAKVYGEWLQGGAPTITADEADELKHRLNGLDGKARAAFKAEFGHPAHLLADKVVAAREFVAAREGGTGDSPDMEGGAQGTSAEGSKEGHQPGRTTFSGNTAPAPNPGDTDRHRTRVNAAMSEVGVRDDDERHALIRYATGGATDSSAGLNAEQAAQVVTVCQQYGAGFVAFRHTLDGAVELVAAESVDQ